MIGPIERVVIENFRSIRQMDLGLHPKVTVLFGSNAAGKTTTLDGLAIGLGVFVARIPKATGRTFAKSGDLRRPWKDRDEVHEAAGVDARYMSVEVFGARGLAWGVTEWRSRQDRKAGLAKTGPKELNDAVDPIVHEILDAKAGVLTTPLPLVAAYGNERAVVEAPLRERNFQTEFDRFGGLDRSLRATTRFKAVFEWFRIMEDDERRESKNREDFHFKLPELEWVRRAVERAELKCANPRVETRPIRMLVDFDHGGGELEPLDINSLSDGYRTHFALVVDIARRMVQLNPSPNLSDPHRGTNSEAVILIDEVDLHLDPAWQGRVVRGLTNAFPNAQFVLTTHSEQVLGSVEAACVRKLVWGDGEVLVEDVAFAQGATGERILVELMGAPERVPGPVTDDLNEYLDMVSDGRGGSAQARVLRDELNRALGQEPRLHSADLEMQRRELIAQIETLRK